MIIETYELERGTSVHQFPEGTRILSACVRKDFEIGRVDERIIVSVEMDRNKVSEGEFENREFIVIAANTLLDANDYTYHGTVVVSNQTEVLHVLSRVI